MIDTTIGTTVNEIKEELIKNIDHYKSIIEHLKKHRAESFNTIDFIFHDDIIEGYKVNVGKVVRMDIAKRFPWNYEDIVIALEDVDLANLLE